jgi:hypothetical protein
MPSGLRQNWLQCGGNYAWLTALPIDFPVRQVMYIALGLG